MKKILIRIYQYLISIQSSKICKKNATLKGKHYKFMKNSRVFIEDGSRKSDIVLGNHVWLFGIIKSQNRGKVTIGNNTRIGEKTRVWCVNSVTIGDYCAIANNVIITDNNTHPISPEFRLFKKLNLDRYGTNLWKYSDNMPVKIGNNVWIGDNARILKGITIGDNSVIAASAVVTKDVPANSIAAGNPAKIVKTDIDKIPMSQLSYETFFKDKYNVSYEEYKKSLICE